MSFLELFDVLNERLIAEGEEPVAFDHDCREGICGSCSMMINGRPHGPRTAPRRASCTCASSRTARTITVEPWRAAAFPISRTSSSTARRSTASSRRAATSPRPPAARPTANLILVPKPVSDTAMDAAACIGCGACVAACPNGAAQLFTAAKVHAPQPAAAGPARALGAGHRHGRRDGARASARARTTASARPRARRRSRSTSSRC